MESFNKEKFSSGVRLVYSELADRLGALQDRRTSLEQEINSVRLLEQEAIRQLTNVDLFWSATCGRSDAYCLKDNQGYIWNS